MIRTILALAAVTAIPTPKPPQVCAPNPALDSYYCPGTDTRYIFTERVKCEAPRVVFEACAVVVDDPAELADPPTVDPDFDEFSPTGPGPGPVGALPVDKP